MPDVRLHHGTPVIRFIMRFGNGTYHGGRLRARMESGRLFHRAILEWHTHENAMPDEAILFSITDRSLKNHSVSIGRRDDRISAVDHVLLVIERWFGRLLMVDLRRRHMEEPKISTRPIAENRTSYRNWEESEGIPLIEGFFIEDIRKVPLEPWARTGGLACRICLAGTGETNDAYICEIPPGKALKPQRHLFEELIFIVSGRGATTVWNNPQSKHTFEWQEGSLFSPPLNSCYQHLMATAVNRPVISRSRARPV